MDMTNPLRLAVVRRRLDPAVDPAVISVVRRGLAVPGAHVAVDAIAVRPPTVGV